MILFCGIPSESPVALAIDAAEDAGIPHVVLHQRQAAHMDLGCTFDGKGVTGSLQIAGARYDLRDFTGIYLRLTDWRTLPEFRPQGTRCPDPQTIAHVEALHAGLLQWTEVAGCRIFNRHSDMASNCSKPYQMQLIAAAGFLTPRTLITNDPEEVRAFANRRRVIYKSISGVRSIVHELTAEACKRLADVVHLPTQFQEYVPGIDIRVHVVGERVFATEVVADAIDYRYSDTGSKFKATELPPEVAARCIKLTRSLRLPLCGLDLRVTPDGEWYCFEANPSPAYSCYEQRTEQPISAAIVQYLAGNAS